MQVITVGFSRPRGKKFPIFSWIIRLVEWTRYSHLYIKWRSDYLDRDLVYEASGTGVHFIEGSRFNNKAETIHSYDILISDSTRKKIIQKAVDNAGAPYGIKQVFGILIVKAARLFGKDIVNPFADGSATWVCSEVLADMSEELGLDIGVHRDNITPRDIQEFLEARFKPQQP